MRRVVESSPDGQRRYRLGRFWGAGAVACVVGLNPSVANAERDDPTNRRLISLLQSAGFSGYWLVNLLPEVEPYPSQLRWTDRRLSAANRRAIERAIHEAERTVVCWGRWGARLAFRQQVLAMAREPWCFGVTLTGEPRHPLYLPNHTVMQRYEALASSTGSCPK